MADDDALQPTDVDQRLMWKLKNMVIGFAVDKGATVFGGAARDKYLHDKHAIQFYRETEEEVAKAIDARMAGADLDAGAADLDADIRTKYDDTTFKPHLFGRWVVPNDVDLFIHESKLANLLKVLGTQFTVKHRFTRDPVKYIPTIEAGADTLEHHCYDLLPIVPSAAIRSLTAHLPSYIVAALREATDELWGKMKEIEGRTARIRMDVMVSKVPLEEAQPKPPFGPVDFLCNGLLLDANGFHLSGLLYYGLSSPLHRMERLEAIFRQIERREAVVHRCPPLHRIRKMMERGWTINSDDAFVHVVKVKGDAPAPADAQNQDKCIICHSEFEGDDAQYKLKCCNARYHARCLVNAAEIGPASMLATETCIMCKRILVDLEGDVTLLRSIDDTVADAS